MLPNLQYAAIRYENFHSEVLLPRVFPLRAPLSVAMWQAPGSGLETEHPSLAEAKRAKYKPVKLGLRWGPVWSTAWFKLLEGVRREWFSMPYQDQSAQRFIWGATAGMLRNFYRLLSA